MLRRRIGWATVGLLLLVRFDLAAFAQPATVELSIATEPALAVAAEAKGEQVLSVSGGSTVQLVVTAHENGSPTDVTSSATYRSLAAGVVTVSESGALQFGAPSGRRVAAVVVEYGGVTRVMAFQVEP
jgi:hypothetical protein